MFANNKDNLPDQLASLTELHRNGLLSDSEFERERRALLHSSKMRATGPKTMAFAVVVSVVAVAAWIALSGQNQHTAELKVAIATSSATSTQVQQAISYATSYVNQNYDDGWCLEFVYQAWKAGGVNIGSSDDPVDYWHADPQNYFEFSSPGLYNNPPAGALVFWGANPWSSEGHVALSLGNNVVVSTSAYPYWHGIQNSPNVFEFSLSQRSPTVYDYLGYMMPLVTQSQSSPPPAPAPTPPPTSNGHSETVGNNTNTWTDYQNAGSTRGTTIHTGQTVQVSCKVQGFKVADGNTWWYQISNSPWDDNYYASADAFYNDGRTNGSLHGTPFVDDSVPSCAVSQTPPSSTPPPPSTSPTTINPVPSPSPSPSPPPRSTRPPTTPTTAQPAPSPKPGSTTTSTTQPTPPPPTPATYAETVGGVTDTWTDYGNAGGNEGPQIPSYTTVQITCRTQGFAVADGNTWWYEAASSPWNNTYWASADAFYNNGQTSGSLLNTPFYDPNVPVC